MGIGPWRDSSVRRGGGRTAVRWTALILFAGLASGPRPSGANPAILFVDGGAGGALLPRRTTDVRIVSERLEFVENAEMAEPAREWTRWELRLPWHVRADYVMENLTAERVEVEVGFPVTGDRGEWDYGGEDSVGFGLERDLRRFTRSFHVRLEGNDLVHREVSNECTTGQDGGTAAGLCYPTLFVFTLAIEAHAQASLTVEYDQAPALCCDAESYPDDIYVWTDYILETGALWAGTIGRLDIVYRFAVPPPAGVRVYDRIVGALLPGEGPWHGETEEGAVRGWSDRAQKVAAPEGVMDLWEPAVRFHYAFACRDGRIVLRLKATDVEPRGNISLGVENLEARLDALWWGTPHHEEDREPCAITRPSDAEPSATWMASGELVRRVVEEPPPDWTCSFERGGTEYRYDCCCAAAAGSGGWNPDCDKPGGAGGKGCAAAASTTGVAPPAPAADAAGNGAAEAESDGGERDALEGGAGVVVAEAAAVDAGPDDSAETAANETTSTPESTPPSSAAPPAARDAATAPAGAPPKKGCGCAVPGSGSDGGPCFAALVALLLAGRRGSRVRRRR
ncbi:MAG: hypothetical protein HY905_19035 [Deltaproteobacteria bacterium]|nr:hypothetical protein [Deltaproteobacteria bacterium]